MRPLLARVLALFRRRQLDHDLSDEISTHLDFATADNVARGLSPEDARRAAAQSFGGTVQTVEAYRDCQGFPWAEATWQDMRYAARSLRRSPAFAAVSVLTLALGIGATTAIFSVVDAVLLRPLPYPESERLAMVWENVNLPQYQNAQNTPAPGNFRDWRDLNSTFLEFAAVRASSWSLTGSGEPMRVSGEAATASLFRALGVKPAIGRIFTPDEDRASPSRVVLLGHSLWVSRFGSNESIVGQTIRLNDELYMVVGVMPAGFRFLDGDDEIWLPLGLTPEQLANHDSHFLRVTGRLKPGVTLFQAQADLDAIATRLATQYPESNAGVGVTVMSLVDQVVGDVRRPLLILLGVVGFVLLMVCANIGNLLLARASAREREFAMRAALGASRLRLIRLVLAEGVLLALIGGGLGLALAAAGVGALRWAAPENLPRVGDLGINGALAAFNVAISLLAAMLCGVTPMLQTGSSDLQGALKDGAHASSAHARRRLRSLLVVVETALGVVVVVGAGLLLRSFVGLMEVPVGFRSDRVLTFRVALPSARYPTSAERTAFYEQLAERLQALPGVRSAGGISFLPLTMQGRTTGVSVEGETPLVAGQVRFVDFRSVSPGYFSSMSIPLLTGRDVAWSDSPTAPPSIVVSDTLARSFWPNQDALGKRIKLGPIEAAIPWLTVVGIVGDVRQLELVKTPRPAIYFPPAQDNGTGDTVGDWIVRTAGEPTTLAAAVRGVVWSIDAGLPLTRIQTMDNVRAAATASQRFNVLLVGLFAILALVLAAVGVYGVTAYAVAQRTRELGIRAALGAQKHQLRRLVLGDAARLAAAGLALGTTVAFALTDVMASLLFGIGARDPITFVGASALLLAVSLVASFIPARRATRADPLIALRQT